MDAEKLLGGLIGGFFGSATSSEAKGGRMKSGGGAVMNQISKGLKSPQGVLAALGLAFGAYEAYRATSQGAHDGDSVGLPPVPSSEGAPPPISGTPPPIPGAAPPPLPGSAEASATAIRLVRAMIAAAHADGVLDEDERQTILTKVKKSGLSDEEERFLLAELDAPKSISELTEGLSDPATKRMLFGLSVAAIVEDTQAETDHLDSLARALGLSIDEAASLRRRFARQEAA